MILDAASILRSLHGAISLVEAREGHGEPMTADEAAAVADTIATAMTYLNATRSAAARVMSGRSAN